MWPAWALGKGHHIDSTPLHLAAKEANVKVMKQLLQGKMEWDADQGKSVFIGRNVNVRNDNQQTPLHTAAASGNLPMAIILMDNGAGLDIQDAQGNTALHLASKGGHAYLVEKLVQRGANLDLLNNDQNLASDVASTQKCFQLLREGAMLADVRRETRRLTSEIARHP